MFNLQPNIKNNHVMTKQNKFWLLIFLASISMFFIATNSNATGQSYNITLPQRVDGVETLQYRVNSTDQGSVDGKTSISLEVNSKLYFLIKIESTGYSHLLAKNVKIVSNEGTTLSLKVLEDDGNGGIVARDVSDYELIDPKQTYGTSILTVSKDETFSVQGVEPDKFNTTVKLEDTAVAIGETLNVTYSDNSGAAASATFNSANNSYVIENITVNHPLQIWISTQPAYSQSNLTYICSDSNMTQSNIDKSLSIPALTSDVSITVQNVTKNQYTVSFTEYTDISFKYKKVDSQSDYTSVPSNGITVTHGDSYSLIYEATGTATLTDKEVTANGIAVRAVSDVYSLNNISESITVAITINTDSRYNVNLTSSENRVTLTDASNNILQNPTVQYNQSFEFKISPTAGYTQNIGSALIYAVPASKLVNNDYDTTSNPTEAAAYLLTPSVSTGVFTISSVTEPMTIVVKNLIINTYRVILPETVTGASYAVTLSDGVTKIPDYENKYLITHGKSLTVTLTADVGKSIANATLISDTNPSVQISKSGNMYTLQNITSDTDIIISNITDAICDISFTGTGIICTDELDTAFDSNKTSVVYGTGIVKFKITASEGYEIGSNGLSVSVISGNATITAPSDSVNYYTLSNATENTVVEITGITIKTLTVSSVSNSDTVKFVSSTTSSEVLPASTTVDYGSDFQFSIASTSGASVSNVTLQTDNGSTVTSLGNDTYVLPNVSENVTIAALTSSAESTGAVDATYWRMAKNVKFVSSPSDACTFTPKNYDPLSNPTTSHPYIPITYFLSDELSYSFVQNHNTPYSSLDFKGYKFYYDENLNYEITDGMLSPDGNYIIHINNTSELPEYSDTTSIKTSISISRGTLLSINITSPFDTYSGNNFGGGIEGDTLSVFDTIYVTAKYLTMNNFQDTTNIHFASPPKGAKYYNVESHQYNALTQHTYVQEGDELRQLTYTLQKGNEFLFIVRLDDGYEMDENAVKVMPPGMITFEKLPNILPAENQYCYKLTNSYTSDVQVYVESTRLKTYDATFSGTGTNFLDENKNQFLSKTFNYGDSLTFTTEAKEGYIDEGLTFKLTTANGEKTLELPTKPSDSSPSTSTSIADSYVNLTAVYDTTTQKIKYTLSSIEGDFSIKVTRQRQIFKIYFEASDGIQYMTTDNDVTQTAITDPQNVEYERNFSFNVVANEGYDLSNMVVTANNTALDFINGKYTIKGITENNTVRVGNINKVTNKITFTQYDGLTFKDTNGNTFSSQKQVNYGDNVQFKIAFSDAYSNSNVTLYAEYSSGTKKEFTKLEADSPDPCLNTTTGVYNIVVKENVRIYTEGMTLNSYNVKLAKTAGISYYNQYGTEPLVSPPGSESNDYIIQPVTYGSILSFTVKANEGYDISNLEVFSKKASVNSARTQMFSSSEVYTVENITEEYTITTENVAKSTCQIEFRVVAGGTCIDESGNNIGNTVTVTYGSDYSFKVSLADAYSNASPTVTLKGTDNTISPNADKSYTISNITSNKIIEIINITKNSYTATFKATEGVIYKNSKNKVFTGTQNVEYGDTFYFKVSLMDAYDESSPWVLLNGDKTLGESGGFYSLENIRDNVEVVVKNVIKNPEEVTMDDINNVPDEIISQDDVDSVVTATQTYNQLSDTEKAEVLSTAKLESAQEKAGGINHKSGDISISGVDWNVKVIVTNLSSDKTQMTNFDSKVDRRSVLSLYEISLLDTLTNTSYSVPYKQKVTVSLPIPDLTGYTNTIVAHENSAGGMEYLDVNIANGTGQFETSSFSLFGVAAKQIPNYVENPSALTISVSSLVDNTEELQTLLGEGLVSQLGNLIDDSENNGTSSSSSSSSGTTGSTSSTDTNSGTSGTSTETESTESLLSNVSSSISSGVNEAQANLSKAYDWAIDNELISVIIILVVGSTLIGIIIFISNKRNKES